MTAPNYRTGAASKVLGCSSRTLRRLAEAGLVDAELSDSSQWLFPADEVERLKREGLPPVPSFDSDSEPPRPVSSRRNGPGRNDSREALLGEPSQELRQDAEGVVAAENQVRKLRLRRQAEEELDWFRGREEREAQRQAEREERRLQAEAEERRRQTQAEAAERKRQAEREALLAYRQWLHRWTAWGLGRTPSECDPASKLAAQKAIREELKGLAVDAPEFVVRQQLEAVIEAAISPWRRKTEREKAIAVAVASLPYGARDSLRPTEWQQRAQEAAKQAVAKLGDKASYPEKLAVARKAVQPIVAEFEHGEACRKLCEVNVWTLGFGATSEDLDEATKAIAEALEELGPTASQHDMNQVRDEILAEIRVEISERQNREKEKADEARRRRENERRVQSALSHLGFYLRTNYEFDSYSDRHQTEQELREEIAPVLRRQLGRHSMSDADLRDMVEERADRLLEPGGDGEEW